MSQRSGLADVVPIPSRTYRPGRETPAACAPSGVEQRTFSANQTLSRLFGRLSWQEQAPIKQGLEDASPHPPVSKETIMSKNTKSYKNAPSSKRISSLLAKQLSAPRPWKSSHGLTARKTGTCCLEQRLADS
jgi:hypothetical protein